ncbi:anti-sigma factor [Paracoccus beibuensis]|uniref:anti-sigma factor n=1 Tax=Paracoccus beibuensis TaxID=547602 RepID=UPI00223F22B1|nr:anti-sigma factor [Paracoccus beibuensis]
MTEDTPLTPLEHDEALAAELALGLLEGPEAQAAVDRLSTDPAFAQAVRDWQERLAGLAEDLTPVMAPARARQGIRQRLGHALPPLETDPLERAPWWRGPMGVLTGLLAVAAVAAFLWLPGQDVPATPEYGAELVAADSDLRVDARVEGREMRLALQSGPAAEGRDWEIWWIGDDGAAISLGVMPRAGEMRMTLPEGLEPSNATSIALSDEPEGGSPTGQATGPVVAVAELTRL